MSSASAGETSCIATYNSDRISPVGAGFLGAGLSLAAMTALIATLMLFGLFSFGSKKSKRSNNDIVISDLREAVCYSSRALFSVLIFVLLRTSGLRKAQ